MYIVTSKPKRISVNSGLVHMILSDGDDAIASRLPLRPNPSRDTAGQGTGADGSVTECSARLYGKITIEGSCFS